MATGAKRRCGRASGSHKGEEEEEEEDDDDEMDQRPEVRIINKYALGRAYIRIGLKGVGALALLWGSVVLLGGFVTVLSTTDLWYLTIIAFVQAAGLLDALGDDRFAFFAILIASLIKNIKRPERKRSSRPTDFLLLVIFIPVVYCATYGPIICIGLSAVRLRKQDYDSADGDASKANLKPALNLFYYVSLVHSAICFSFVYVEFIADIGLARFVSHHHGFISEVLDGYYDETKRMCANNPASTESWNLITYGAGLLDSELPDDYALGVRAVTMLIEKDTPIRRVLIRSPRRRINKLIGALVWRSPVEREARWLSARIVEHIAGELNLAQFPGASECVSSLLDTCSHNHGDHEAVELPARRSKARRGNIARESLQLYFPDKEFQYKIQKYRVWRNGGREDNKQHEEHVDINATKGRPDFARHEKTVITNGDLILQGLRILENLAHDQHNCTVIYNTKGLVSKIIAPVSSNSLTEDIKTNGVWIQVVDASLKVISLLMRTPADTGREICRQIADSSNAVRNLEAVMGLHSSNNCILELQMRAMEVLARLFFHGSTSWSEKRREYIIERALHIFLIVECVECYLAEKKKIKTDKETSNQQPKGTHNPFNMARETWAEKKLKLLEDKKMKSLEDKQMEEAKETASQIKEKAGEALVMLSTGSQSNSEVIRSLTDVVHRLTGMLDCKTIKCKISESKTVEAKLKIGCRISAAVILKNLCPYFTTPDDDYVTKTTLKKVLVELLHIITEPQAQESSTIASTHQLLEHCIAVGRDLENPRDNNQDEFSALQCYKQQAEERRLQAALLSLCVDICAKYNIKAPGLATMVAPEVSRGDFVGNLKKMVEQNSHATPACLAILKLTCQMVEELILDDQTGEDIIGMLSQIVIKLSEASDMMAGVESSMLFAGTDGDCYGVPVKPLLYVLVKKAEESLERRKNGLGMNTPAGGP